MTTKTQQLLSFLRDMAKIRRKRIWAYGEKDNVLWLNDVPAAEPECHSPFHEKDTNESPSWLKVIKPKIPQRPKPPTATLDWIPGGEERLDDHKAEFSELRSEITIVAPIANQNHDDLHDDDNTIAQTLKLTDFPDLEDVWTEYLVDRWMPWAEEMLRLENILTTYEKLDTMRRRLEEAAETYELVLALGLLQWRDSTGKSVTRHLVVASAEIEFIAEKGEISIVPAASFDACRLELDMLEPPDQPKVDHDALQEKLGEIGMDLWSQNQVGPILLEISNLHGVDSRVIMDTLERQPQANNEFCISFAPAVVLRHRQPIAYDELVKGFLESEEVATTTPWNILTGDSGSRQGGNDNGHTTANCLPAELHRYLPLATNQEQEKIIDRLEQHSAVVVKGPPGTGKSHTIANLMCHLLARGERILVTAHAPKALSVLLEKLPNDIAELCVSALASSREDLELLKKSVSGIQNRWNNREEDQSDDQDIDCLEVERLTIEEQLQKTLRAMREVREAENHSHELPGGYSGTATAIAQQLEASCMEFEWITSSPELNHEFPLSQQQLNEMSEISSELTEERCLELDLDLGSSELPDPEAFTNASSEYRASIQEHKSFVEDKSKSVETDLDLAQLSDTDLEDMSKELRLLEDCIIVAERVFPNKVAEILKDLLAGRNQHYRRLNTQADEVTAKVAKLLGELDKSDVKILEVDSKTTLKVDVERRLKHLKAGGRRGFWLLKPAVVRETDYIEKICSVDNQPAKEAESLDIILAFLHMQSTLEKFGSLWSGVEVPQTSTDRELFLFWEETFDTLELLVNTIDCQLLKITSNFAAEKRIQLADRSVRSKWRNSIDLAHCVKREAIAKAAIQTWLHKARASTEGNNRHSVIDKLANAIKRCDSGEYEIAWQERENLLEGRLRQDRYHNWKSELDSVCPGSGEHLKSWLGDPAQYEKIKKLEAAFRWIAARHWLRDRIRDSAREELSERARIETESLQQVVEKLASIRAWDAFFQRIEESPQILRDLSAWRQAQQRIGRGTGVYAFRHRQEARDYLMRCVSELPAWIMPLHKVWENAKAIPGLFDTVIIDEASQAGVDSVLLLLLAKRIIVVGDDKQNSPVGVGVREDDIANLVRQHLPDFPYGRAFRHDSSLFDHAERDFGNLVSLREHFRCVPDIIRFSNDHFYQDAPLIPLRQRPPESLPPLRASFVEGGAAEGGNQQIRNPIEADALVTCIQHCLEDEQYQGKTMGVIVLQGRAQTELIETMLRDKLDPMTIENVKLRCGDSTVFQGDQRDIMFLSMVVAPNKNYAARTTLADQRRYNVAMSRARDQVWVFHSVAIHDLSRDCLRNKLLQHVKGAGNPTAIEHYEEVEWLEQQAAMPHRLGEQPAPFDSWFEVEVALELLRRHYRVHPQFEVEGRPRYRIDLVIEGTDGRLAVECNGPHHLEPEQIVSDQERQRQLERADWEFVTVSSCEYYYDRISAVRKVEDRCRELGIYPTSSCLPEDEADSAVDFTIGADDVNAVQIPEVFEDFDADIEETPLEVSNSSKPFSGYDEDNNYPDPRETAISNIRQALLEIIEKDGPLSFPSIVRLYREGCPSLDRAAGIVQAKLRKALGVMKRMKHIEVEAELENGSPEGLIYRIQGTQRVHERPAGLRKLEEIPPSELANVFSRYDKPLKSISNHWQVIQERYGYQRLTAPRRKYITKVIREAKKAAVC